ncbi:MAG: DUF933 domain-containing protein [Planctomycetota bacterium]
MRVAIVGFPYAGKTSLFTAISGVPPEHLKAGEENLAAVHIPEPRLDLLERVFKPRKRTEATMEFVDLPGSAEGDVEKAGLERHLPTLRQADGLLLIVRAFESPSVPPHGGSVDAERDLRLLHDEMMLADLMIASNRVERIEKALAKVTKDRDQLKHELDLLLRCKTALEAEQPLRKLIDAGIDEKTLRSFGFLTLKPLVTVINVGEGQIGQPPPVRDGHATETLSVCAALEAELLRMEAADRPEFMREYGILALARDRVIRACFHTLDMIMMLTGGDAEVRAWALPRGTTALDAAAKIHTDLARGFVKAETVAWDDLRAAGSMRDAKSANKVRLEPKGYVIQDGDVVLIKSSLAHG